MSKVHVQVDVWVGVVHGMNVETKICAFANEKSARDWERREKARYGGVWLELKQLHIPLHQLNVLKTESLPLSDYLMGHPEALKSPDDGGE